MVSVCCKPTIANASSECKAVQSKKVILVRSLWDDGCGNEEGVVKGAAVFNDPLRPRIPTMIPTSVYWDVVISMLACSDLL